MAFDFLHVFWNLHRKKIAVGTTCVSCGQYEETTSHAIQDCTFTRECWKLSGLMEAWKVDETQSMMQWLVGVATTSNQIKFDKGIVLAWAIWGSRNDEVKNNVKNSPTRTSTFTLQYAEDFAKAHQQADFCGVPLVKKWKNPKHGFVKVNFDEAVCEAECTDGS
ncbi:hypothetical protein REPUB_Repub03eG0072600 [Reevesia pubescens]